MPVAVDTLLLSWSSHLRQSSDVCLRLLGSDEGHWSVTITATCKVHKEVPSGDDVNDLWMMSCPLTFCLPDFLLRPTQWTFCPLNFFSRWTFTVLGVKRFSGGAPKLMSPNNWLCTFVPRTFHRELGQKSSFSATDRRSGFFCIFTPKFHKLLKGCLCCQIVSLFSLHFCFWWQNDLKFWRPDF